MKLRNMTVCGLLIDEARGDVKLDMVGSMFLF